MVTCGKAIDNLKEKIIKEVTEKNVMEKLDKKKFLFEITEKNLREKIEDITRKDFLSALVHFKKIQKKSKKSGRRSKKGGHWMSWFVYILCRLSEDDSLYDYVMSTCDEDFEELEQAAAEYYNSLSDDAVSPAAAVSPLADAVSPLAAAVPDVTYTVSSISSMTAAQRQEIPPGVVDSWGYDGRYDAYNEPTDLGGGGKKTRRKRKTKKRRKRKKRKSHRRKRKTKKKRSSRKRR